MAAKSVPSSLRAHVARWRHLALAWQSLNAPNTSFQQLVRLSEVEVSGQDRSCIRKDIERSTPLPFREERADSANERAHHAARLERVLCAWVIYDSEIGYVQAMNLVCSTLLHLLDGDEEASFWVLVTLLRQLPQQFYSRAPLQLLGFWVEVEVLSQLAERLLGFRGGLRGPLLQIGPRWFLEWWVGTLPLNSLVLVWTHLLENACPSGLPSVLNLQIALAILQLLRSQLVGLLGGSEANLQLAYQVLQGVQLPETDGSQLLQSALEVPLEDGTIQEMRLQLRLAVLERCKQILPVSNKLPLVCAPLPLLTPPQPTEVADRQSRSPATRLTTLSKLLYGYASSVLLFAMVASLAMFASQININRQLIPLRSWLGWALLSADAAALLFLITIATGCASCQRRFRCVVILLTAFGAVYTSGKAVALLVHWPARSEASALCSSSYRQLIFRRSTGVCGQPRWWPLALAIAIASSAALQLVAVMAARLAQRRGGSRAYDELSEVMTR